MKIIQTQEKIEKDAGYIFKLAPWKHQINALRYLIDKCYGALYCDMGTGKTKIMIDLIVNKDFQRTIIVCPKKVGYVWANEFKKFSDLSDSILNLCDVSGNMKLPLIKENLSKCNLVIIINYDSIWRDNVRDFFLNTFKADCVICDESHRIKTPGSKCSKFLALLGKRTKNRYLMSGTPLAQSPLDIYAQYRFLEPSIFGTNFNNFKFEYANWVSLPTGINILDKRNPYKNLDKLHEKMFSCAFKQDSEVELPETQDITLEAQLDSKTEKHYHQLKKECVLSFGKDVVEATTVLTSILRLQQLTSGYLKTVNIETKQENFIEIDTAKKDTLKELLEDLPPNEPVVVFARFTKDIKNIKSVCEELKISCSEVSGQKNELAQWKKGVIVVQIASGAEGIDLTKARYCVYYSLTPSLGQYLQSRKRVHRPGQTRPVIYYHIVATMKKGSTIDELMRNALQNNQDIINKIMEDKDL